MKRRIFVALNLSDALKNEILDWRKQIKMEKDLIRWLKPQNLHITLLPPWYVESIDETTELLESNKNWVRPIKIHFDQIEFGPTLNYPRLIWAKGQSPSQILELKNKLEKILNQEPEKRDYLLHLTVARFRPENFKNFSIKKLGTEISWKDQIESFSLLESHLSPKGASYEVLLQIPLI